MYSVFLVDDESIVLEGIRTKINWEESGFTYAGEATDGELAFSMIQEIKPDILITDIKMPFMDGLSLSQMLKKIQPWIKIIILTGHDEFDYAKKAISVGIEDFILKPFSPEELLASLNKIAIELDKERKQFSDMVHLKEELESTTALLRDKFLTDLVQGNLDTTTSMQRAENLQIDLLSRFYVVSISEIHPVDNNSNFFSEAKVRLFDLLREKNDCIAFFITPNKFVCIVKSNSEKGKEDECYNIAEAIAHELSKNLDCTVVTAIGNSVEHVSHITNSYKDAERVLELCRAVKKNRIVSVEDIKQSSDGLISLQENDPLVDQLKYAGEGEIDKIITQFMGLLQNNSEHFSIIASYLLVDVIMAVSKLVEDLGGNIKNVMPEILTHAFVDNAVKDQETFISEIRRVLTVILGYRNSRMQGKYGDVILKAKQFIEKNYASQDTCLSSVSEQVHLSPNHFSTIFSQECGVTFIEYLTEVRIEQAKKLLKTTDMKGSDIAYETGFSDPHYFSFIFKKTTGLSPREYRNSEQTK
jgi:two-component system response regulator YesN